MVRLPLFTLTLQAENKTGMSMNININEAIGEHSCVCYSRTHSKRKQALRRTCLPSHHCVLLAECPYVYRIRCQNPNFQKLVTMDERAPCSVSTRKSDQSSNTIAVGACRSYLPHLRDERDSQCAVGLLTPRFLSKQQRTTKSSETRRNEAHQQRAPPCSVTVSAFP